MPELSQGTPIFRKKGNMKLWCHPRHGCHLALLCSWPYVNLSMPELPEECSIFWTHFFGNIRSVKLWCRPCHRCYLAVSCNLHSVILNMPELPEESQTFWTHFWKERNNRIVMPSMPWMPLSIIVWLAWCHSRGGVILSMPELPEDLRHFDLNFFGNEGPVKLWCHPCHGSVV